MVDKPKNRNYPPPVYVPKDNSSTYQPDTHEGDFKRLVDDKWREMFPQGLNGNRLAGRLPREQDEDETDAEDVFW